MAGRPSSLWPLNRARYTSLTRQREETGILVRLSRSYKIIQTHSSFLSEPPPTTWQPHTNGIFDIKWNSSDTLLATASGDQSTRISCLTTTATTHVLRGHTSTVKCVTWDPNHKDMLSTGGRDGAVCVWDLRVGEGRSADGDGTETLRPVMMIPGAHETAGSKGMRKRKGKTVPMAKSVTSLVYPDTEPYGLISGGSFDGYVILHIVVRTV
jgi:denticleless